ncbi:MAG: NAD(P)-dependent dehydrogenase (short-subunit alcohol dehydrogenase family) [Acidimicrobiales bacterium]|jgi:NAD(P)-dependent dehydrogenase (short-subunit alcohol dehydrogenase family)
MSEIDISVAGRLEGKVALVVGGGQTPGSTVGNGRATAMLLARAGAIVVVADRFLDSAQGTVDLILDEGGSATATELEVTEDDQHRSVVEEIVSDHGRLDILHNNVGVSIAGGDADALEIDPDTFDRLWEINLKSVWMASRHAIPVMREQGAGSVVSISSMAAKLAYPLVAYKTTKVAMLGLTENLAVTNARYGVRVNAILPGLMNTPMAIEARVGQGTPREEVVASRDRQVPLGRRMGSGWDVAHAALFLHSDEARFITGVSLQVDGGQGLVG